MYVTLSSTLVQLAYCQQINHTQMVVYREELGIFFCSAYVKLDKNTLLGN